MENEKNIILNAVEWTLFQDKSFMPVKARVLEKIEFILGRLGSKLETECRKSMDILSEAYFDKPPKLSRGENYSNYAYRVMDFPRFAKGESLFLYRCVVLWGHPIGFHLILQGEPKREFEEAFKDNYHQLPAGFFISNQESPWKWESEDDDLISLRNISANQVNAILTQRPFLKLSCFLPLKSYLDIPEVGVAVWGELARYF